MEKLLHTVDTDLGVRQGIGYHHKPDHTVDIQRHRVQYQQANVLDFTPGREYRSFSGMYRNPMSKLNTDKILDWMRDKLKYYFIQWLYYGMDKREYTCKHTEGWRFIKNPRGSSTEPSKDKGGWRFIKNPRGSSTEPSKDTGAHSRRQEKCVKDEQAKFLHALFPKCEFREVGCKVVNIGDGTHIVDSPDGATHTMSSHIHSPVMAAVEIKHTTVTDNSDEHRVRNFSHVRGQFSSDDPGPVAAKDSRVIWDNLAQFGRLKEMSQSRDPECQTCRCASYFKKTASNLCGNCCHVAREHGNENSEELAAKVKAALEMVRVDSTKDCQPVFLMKEARRSA
uniref:Uncharacterized protein n=1 Tax=Branchiostoma floridae TaxID=7739 RepID=C3ZB17_BRAFL|eukprot:XP_002594043.1 hypothetical protein BRAFLDRAFT_68517 [Branchiostoma floridae]